MATESSGISSTQYNSILKDISLIYENAQTEGDGNWNKTTLFAHWKIGERIIEVEQGQKERAAYGDMVLKQLSKDLSKFNPKFFSYRRHTAIIERFMINRKMHRLLLRDFLLSSKLFSYHILQVLIFLTIPFQSKNVFSMSMSIFLSIE